MSTSGDVQYIGDTMSTSGDIMSTLGDIMSTLGAYHEYIGGCSVTSGFSIEIERLLSTYSCILSTYHIHHDIHPMC